MKDHDCNTPKIKPASKKVDGITIVIIPAQLGGSAEGELYAPATCKYKNTLVKYLADGMVYLYDKDGNWTLVADSDIDQTIDDKLSKVSKKAVQNKVITIALEGMDGNLKALIESEATARSQADVTLQGNIDTEEARAKGAEATLDNKIDGEIQNVTESITAETTRATAAETTLGTRITNEETARTTADTTLRSDIDAEASTRAAEDVAIRADLATEIAKETEDIRQVQSELNRDFVNDLKMSSDAQSVTFTEDKINPVTGAVSKEYDIIPTASATTAGTMSAAEFNSITDSQQKLEALLSGAVVIYDLPENPSQEQLTTAWENETQRDELINRASIYDATNFIVWTYYVNASIWEPISASGGSVTVNQWSNTTAGIVLGSTLDGNISANTDGTGSVNGWSGLKNEVSTNTTKLSGIEAGAQKNVQSDWTQTTTTADSFIKNKPTLSTVATTGEYSDLSGTPTLAAVATTGDYSDLSNTPTIPTVNNATLTIQKNGTNVATFTANSATNTTANLSIPTSFSDLSGTVGTSQIANKAVTSDKIDSATLTTENLADEAVTEAKMAFPKMIIRGVNGAASTSVYKIDFTGSKANSFAVGFVYARYKTKPIPFSVQINASGNISSFTMDDSDFAIEMSDKVVTVKYSRPWSQFILAFPMVYSDVDDRIAVSVSRG